MSHAAHIHQGRGAAGANSRPLHSTISAVSTFDAPDGIERYVVLREAEFRAMQEALVVAESMAEQSILEAAIGPATEEIADLSRKSGNTVAAVRTARRMSINHLANRTGIAEHNITGIEDGTRRPTLTSIRKIAKVLDVTIDELVNT